jgi:hypothetical protein
VSANGSSWPDPADFGVEQVGRYLRYTDREANIATCGAVVHSFAMDDVTPPTSYGAEFDFESNPVGLFRDQAFPIEPGEYEYEPYRGPAHCERQRAPKSGAEVICNCMLNDQRVSFRVLSRPPAMES